MDEIDGLLDGAGIQGDAVVFGTEIRNDVVLCEALKTSQEKDKTNE